jgi:hypothetical protein
LLARFLANPTPHFSTTKEVEKTIPMGLVLLLLLSPSEARDTTMAVKR